MKVKVIVDSRNVHGQSRHVLGVGSCPTVQGLVDGFGAFGFEVNSVAIGLALARPRDQIALHADHVANELYKAEVEADPRGTALLGELHLRDGKVAEKIVDVQCALAIALSARDITDGKADYEGIIVCSQDVDLRPALEYAESLGVPIWVAAHDVVHVRPQPFILLTTRVMSTFRTVAEVTGHERRTLIAQAAMSPDVREWELVEPSRDGSTWYMLDGDGTPGRCFTRDLTSSASSGAKVLMGIKSVNVGKSGTDFPILYLGRHPASAPVAQEGTVVRRRRELEIEVDLAGTRIRVPYDLGGVLPGMKVAVTEHITPSGQRKKIVLGTTNRSALTNAKKLLAVSATPVIVTSTGNLMGPSRTKVESDVGVLALGHIPGRSYPRGARLAAVLADVGAWGKFPVAFPISSTLP